MCIFLNALIASFFFVFLSKDKTKRSGSDIKERFHCLIMLINDYCSSCECQENKYTTITGDANKLLLTRALKIRAACISWTMFCSLYSFRIIKN